mmetsp:Transcript_45026/g.89195  ORF Transcript_45026/g.89195 Transcript_45026/m.89195 type:complete len:108 (-) Transcript_45026:140-463(-)
MSCVDWATMSGICVIESRVQCSVNARQKMHPHEHTLGHEIDCSCLVARGSVQPSASSMGMVLMDCCVAQRDNVKEQCVNARETDVTTNLCFLGLSPCYARVSATMKA